MQDEKEAQTRNMLRSEIDALLNQYKALSAYVAGAQYDATEIVGTLQVFKDGLNNISSYILALYVSKGQKTKITWEPLLANINNALENLRASPHPQPRTAIQLAFNMSEPNAQEVMAYLAKFKESLQ